MKKLKLGDLIHIERIPILVIWMLLVLFVPMLYGSGGGSLGGGTATQANSLTMQGEVSAKATGVTITAGGTEVTSIDLGTVTSGDRAFVTAYMQSSKGGTAGTTAIYMEKKSGTATIVFNNAATVLETQWYQEASSSNYFPLTGIVNVTGSGTLILRLGGDSQGSDSTATGELYGVFLKKQ